jgi:hypothetical protein
LALQQKNPKIFSLILKYVESIIPNGHLVTIITTKKANQICTRIFGNEKLMLINHLLLVLFFFFFLSTVFPLYIYLPAEDLHFAHAKIKNEQQDII